MKNLFSTPLTLLLFSALLFGLVPSSSRAQSFYGYFEVPDDCGCHDEYLKLKGIDGFSTPNDVKACIDIKYLECILACPCAPQIAVKPAAAIAYIKQHAQKIGSCGSITAKPCSGQSKSEGGNDDSVEPNQ